MSHHQTNKGQGTFDFAVDAANAAQSRAPKNLVGFQATDEQRTIQAGMNKLYAGDAMVIDAFAGAGKTSTLKLASLVVMERGGQGIYLAFNSSIAKEATSAFRKFNVECRTFHSLAYRAILGRGMRCYPMKLRDIETYADPALLKKLSGASGLKGARLHALVHATVEAFCNSDKTRVTEEIAGNTIIKQFGDPMSGGEAQRMQRRKLLLARTELAEVAQSFWKRVCRPSELGHSYHNVYFKLFELDSNAIAQAFKPYACVFADEGQDFSGVQTSVIRKLLAYKRQVALIVGDEFQQIYSWRGADDALKAFDTPHRYSLTGSFRFGENVADLANRVLDRLPNAKPDRKKVRGLGPAENVKGEAILARSNMGVLFAALVYPERSIYVPGGIEELVAMFEDAVRLRTNRLDEIRTEDFRAYTDWQDFLEEADATNNSSMKAIAKMVDQKDWSEHLNSLRERIVQREGGEVLTIGTTHKLKGREYEKVTIWEDFPDLAAIEMAYDKAKAKGDQTAMATAIEEYHLFYVAVTRASKTVDLPQWAKGYLGLYQEAQAEAARQMFAEPANEKYLAVGQDDYPF